MRKYKFIIPISVVLTFPLVVVLFPLDGGKLFKPSSQTVYDREDKLLRAFLSADEKWRMPCRLDEISPYLKETVIAVEDRFFRYHPGVNPWSLVRALYLNLKQGRIVSGGSTITMQVARMMEHRERTLLSKVIEIIRALKLELLYSKDEILQFYFNMAPYGSNVEGVEAACYYYFQKSPAEISLSQAALLVAVPNSPLELNPERFPEKARGKRNEVLAYLRGRGVITDAEYLRAVQEEIDIDRPGIPFEVVDHEHDEDYEKGACEDRLEHVHQIHQACVSPHPAIQVEKRKKADLNQNDKMPALLEGRQVLLRNVKFEAKEIR